MEALKKSLAARSGDHPAGKKNLRRPEGEPRRLKSGARR